MATLKRQLTEPEKKQVLAQQGRNGVLYCFVDDHPIEDENDVEFHHIKPFSEDGRPTSGTSVQFARTTIAASAHSRSRSSATNSQ
jgi:hypothetical protein